MKNPINVTSPWASVVCIFGILGAMVVPATITLSTVIEARDKVPPEPHPTPYGYTYSLLLFIVPCVVLGIWFLLHPKYKPDRRSFWISVAVLFGLGAGLDFLFATSFFTFNNPGATIGLDVPVVGGSVPIEEFGFYLTGFLAILLIYIWSNEFWLGNYHKVVVDKENAPKATSLLGFHFGWTTFAVIAIALAFVWKKFGAHDWSHGFPGYFLFLLAIGVAPSILFFKAVGHRINWRALCFTAMLLLPVSLLWEGVLANPYQWWGYQEHMMLGIYIGAMSNLPVEAVLLWLVVAYAGVTIYEVIRLWCGVQSHGPQPGIWHPGD